MNCTPTSAHAGLSRNSTLEPVDSFPASRYCGLAQSAGAAATTPWLGNMFAQMLDEIDFGMLLLDDELEVVHINQVARCQLDAQHPLQLRGAALRARQPADGAIWAGALKGATQHGLRRLLSLGAGSQAVNVAVVPLSAPAQGGGAAILVVLGKRAVCGELGVQWFARNQSLTQAETRVLSALCAGYEPREIAKDHGLTLHTIRTQIGSLRAKTGALSIRDLIRHVSMLPPLVSAPHRITSESGDEASTVEARRMVTGWRAS